MNKPTDYIGYSTDEPVEIAIRDFCLKRKLDCHDAEYQITGGSINVRRRMDDKKTEYKAYLYIRDYENREVVHKIGLTNTHPDHVEKVMRGVLRQLDTERFFVDDSEVGDGN